ncbi:MAG: SDR family oxidoreductase [Methylobacteriaceae bacterium]|nr:SDR family oxidoreductase [Methylobacteriaceae bacterium]
MTAARLPRTPSFRLDGRKALVTGASRGIGLACAVALAEAGAHVVCAARGVADLDAAVAAMRAAGLSAESAPLDMDDKAAVDALIAGLGPLDVVVNSAGIARHGPALDKSEEDYDAVMRTNGRAAYFLSVAAARSMRAHARRGSIIHISSQMGHVGGVDRTVYSASKHAVEGMVKSMAIEWGKQGIRINTVCPTFIRTAFTQSTFDNPERLAWILSKIKLDRVGEVEDVMGAVVFLAGDAAAMITGASLLVDGGWTAG